MAKTHKHLWKEVASLGNLMQAANLAMRGKRSLAPAAGFSSPGKSPVWWRTRE